MNAMRFLRFAVLPGVVLGVLMGLLQACGGEPGTPAARPASHALDVVAVATGAPQGYTAIGSVVSDSRIAITSRLSGYVRELPAREGDRVRRGDRLARIDSPDVEGAIGQARAARSAAEAAARDAQVDVERFGALYAKGLVSESDMRKVRLKADAARESLNQAQAALERAEAERRYAEILSPIDGVVVAVQGRVGDLAVPGAPILIVESGGDLLFDTTVTEREVGAIRPGMPVAVRLDGLDRVVDGRVLRVVESADPVTRTYPVKIALDGEEGVLPGMFGRADFPLGDVSDAVRLPRAALVERSGLTGVFVVDDGGLLRFRWLRLGREWPGEVEVTAGLAPGERVAIGAGPAVREGDSVAVRAVPRATPNADGAPRSANGASRSADGAAR